MSAHESMEHAEHAEHASGENKKIALLIAVIALLPRAIGNARQGRADRIDQQECRGLEPLGVLPGQEHPPHRGADRRRSGQARLGRCSDDAAKAALQKQIDDWQKTAARYRSEPEPAKAPSSWPSAPSMPRKSAISRRRNTITYELASAAFQIGIVLASATIITGIDRAGLDLRPAGAGRHRHDRARPVRAASAASALSSSRRSASSYGRTTYRASCTLLRKRWISRSVRDDQPSPSPRSISMMRVLTGSTSAAAFARSAMMNS